MRGERDLRVDNVKGVLILLVVIGHFLLPVSGERLTKNLLYMIYVFHMPCFLMVSGYLSHGVYTYEKGFRWDKWIQLLWLFVIYKLMVNVTEGLLAGQIRRVPDFFHESGAPWYLLVLIFYYLLTPLYKRMEKYRLLVLAAVSLLSAFSGYLPFLSDFLAIDRFVAFAPFFLLGYYAKRTDVDRFMKSPCRKTVQAAAVVIELAVGLLTYDRLQKVMRVVYGAAYYRYSEDVYRFCWLLAIIWQAASVMISLGMASCLPARKIPVFTKLGQRSLQVYMLHRPLRDLWQYFGFPAMVRQNSVLSVAALFAGSFLLTLALGCSPIVKMFEWIRSVPNMVLQAGVRVFGREKRLAEEGEIGKGLIDDEPLQRFRK